MSTLYWLTSIAAMIVVWLNVKRYPSCFLVWMCTNLIWAYADLVHGLHAQSALMLVYFGLSVWGFYSWTRRPPPSNPPGSPAGLRSAPPPRVTRATREVTAAP